MPLARRSKKIESTEITQASSSAVKGAGSLSGGQSSAGQLSAAPLSADNLSGQVQVSGKAKRTNGTEIKNGVGSYGNGERSPQPETQITEIDSHISVDMVERDAIAFRAWEIWQREGCPEGRALEHWVQAEQEIQSEVASER
jgi:hypothetical protein